MTILTVGLAVIIILIIVTIYFYNKLVTKRNYMNEAWSGIDVYLKKRYDLIPNLIETVKAYASHEKQLMESITQQRVSAMQSRDTKEKIQAESGLTQAIGQLIAVAENYPDLKANTNYLQLQSQLETIESEIEMSRRYYNGTVRENNILVESVPSNIIASIFNFQKGTFFEVQNAAERESNRIHF